MCSNNACAEAMLSLGPVHLYQKKQKLQKEHKKIHIVCLLFLLFYKMGIKNIFVVNEDFYFEQTLLKIVLVFLKVQIYEIH